MKIIYETWLNWQNVQDVLLAAIRNNTSIMLVSNMKYLDEESFILEVVKAAKDGSALRIAFDRLQNDR